jgi:hypothetical protein
MSEENVEIVRRFQKLMVESHARDDRTPAGGWGQVLDLLDPAISVPVCPSLPHGGDWVGHDGYLKMIEQVTKWRTTIGGQRSSYILDAGEDHVLLVITFESKSVKTGRTFPIRMVELYTLRDGKITELIPYYWDIAPMLAAEREQQSA